MLLPTSFTPSPPLTTNPGSDEVAEDVNQKDAQRGEELIERSDHSALLLRRDLRQIRRAADRTRSCRQACNHGDCNRSSRKTRQTQECIYFSNKFYTTPPVSQFLFSPEKVFFSLAGASPVNSYPSILGRYKARVSWRCVCRRGVWCRRWRSIRR